MGLKFEEAWLGHGQSLARQGLATRCLIYLIFYSVYYLLPQTPISKTVLLRVWLYSLQKMKANLLRDHFLGLCRMG